MSNPVVLNIGLPPIFATIKSYLIMPVDTRIKPERLSLKNPIPGIDDKYYQSIATLLDGLGSENEFDGNTAEYNQSKVVIANLIYIIHERFVEKITREINYRKLKKWGAENKGLARYLLNQQFPTFDLKEFDAWIEPAPYLTKMRMYGSSDAKTKDTFH
jgi:hypothetical protein